MPAGYLATSRVQLRVDDSQRHLRPQRLVTLPVPPATPAAVLPLVLAVEAMWSHTTASSDDDTAPAQKMAASRSVDASFGQSATMLSLP